MKWMVDFAEAEKVGMGIRLRLTADDAQQGFDFLLVFGTRAALGLTDGTDDLIKLLDAHHYTDGLSFVLQGTPSNNTPDAPSGFSSVDPGQEESYLAERGTKPFQAGDQSNADVLTRALGLKDEKALTLGNLANAKAVEQLEARHMNRALWPATWGYFIAQMIGTPLTQDDNDWTRRHFIDHVRAAGPLPAIRIGKQPYGILPVTTLDNWKPTQGKEDEQARDVSLKNFLLSLRNGWRVNLNQVPRLGRNANPQQDFVDILSMDAVSSTYSIRHLMGETYLRQLWTSLVATVGNQEYWWRKQLELTQKTLTGFGIPWTPRLAKATYSGWLATLFGPAVQPEMGSETAPLKPNYIELLLKETDLEKLRTESFNGDAPRGLLYAVLRHALLLEYWMAVSKLELLRPADPLAFRIGSPGFLRHEPEIVFDGAVTPWQMLRNALPPNIANSAAWDFLSKLKDPPADPAVAEKVRTLLELRESLAHLSNVSAAKLQRLFAGTLDLCSHRLDAWITSFATKRLADLREVAPNGILLGGYGWVMNLKPAPKPPMTEAPPAGEQGVFLQPIDNPGYSHAPSLAQAATVAVLRSGHRVHADANTKEVLSIDLTSERVRLAEWLLDGVRAGQPLGALLGYRFERRLQEHRPPLGQFIPAFREGAPLVAKKLEDPGGPVESIAANNVVDGLLLQRKWSATQDLATLFAGLPNPPAFTGDQAEALRIELNSLDDAVDAVSDALLAETVHHAIEGNPLRTASTLDAVASGEAPPPELDVVRTPRTGVALTHRVVALFDGSAQLPGSWASASSPRADAEPALNAWTASLLGDPTRVRCQVERIDPETSEVLEVKEFRLNDLALAPLDFIYAAEGSRDGQPSEIEQRILYAMSRDSFPPAAFLRINSRRGAGWTTSDLSYGEFAELLHRARKLVTGTRGIDASELALPEQNLPPAVDLADLQIRADKAAEEQRQALAELQTQLENQTPDLESLRKAILRCSLFGIAGAVPFTTGDDAHSNLEVLKLQGASIAGELAKRVDELANLEKSFDGSATPEEDKRRHQVERLQVVFGSSFVVCPRFSVANSDELQKALGDSTRVQDNDPLAVVTWFHRVSRVRDGVERLDFSLRYAEVLGTGSQLNLKVAQLPYKEDDRWVGLSLQPDQALSPSRFSLVIQAASDIDVNKALTGVLIDEWVEIVPNTSETTAMVFQYDQPDASPPQSILLAVPPDLEQPWSLWSLQQVLLETLDLARIRAVDPESLDEVGHYIPALYFAVNSAGDAISMDFTKLKLK
jgi:hypothetical protein